MKRIVKSIIVVGLMVGLLGSNAIAQEKKAAAPAKGAETAKAAQPAAGKRQVRTILDYKTELNLTEDQTKKIRDNLNSLDKEFRVMKANLSLLNVDLQNLMEKDADIAEIKKKVKESYDIQANMRIADLETARNINKVLSKEQLARWKTIRSQGKK